MLIGDGPQKQRLQSRIAELNLGSNITMTGEESHHEVLKLMQRAKIFLHPSSYEGFGIVCIEALCSAAHVISFVKPMNGEIENWHIVTSKEEMRNKSIEILRDPEVENKKIIPFTIEQSIEKMADLLSL